MVGTAVENLPEQFAFGADIDEVTIGAAIVAKVAQHTARIVRMISEHGFVNGVGVRWSGT